MNFIMIVLIILFTFILFLIMNYLENKSISLTDKVILPNIYIILIASLVSILKDYVFLIVIFYLVFDVIYKNIITRKYYLLNRSNYLKNIVLTLTLDFLIHFFFLLKVNYAFVDMEIFKNFIWVLIIIYLYQKLNLGSIDFETKENLTYEDRFKEYVIVNYARFKNKYSYLITSKDIINKLIYSFLIYEEYNYKLNFNLIKEKILDKDNRSIEEKIILIKEKIENREKKIRNKNDDNYLKKLIMERYKYKKAIDDVLKIYNIIAEFNK